MNIESKYTQVIEYVIDFVNSNNLNPGHLLISENKLAEQLGISRVTVRKAYGFLEEKGCIKRNIGKGTFIDENFFEFIKENKLYDNNRHLKIGVIFPEIHTFFGKVLSSIESVAKLKGYTINFSLNDTVATEKNTLLKLIRDGVDGIIITPIRYYGNYSIENYVMLEESGIPFVMLGKPPVNILCDAVYGDDVYGAYIATKAMFDKGCKAILHITNSHCDKESYFERIEGYSLAISNSFGDDNKKIILDMANPGFKQKLYDILYNESGKIGILMYDDLFAPIIFDIISKAKKRVPTDVCVIGYSNVELCENLPIKLSSVDVSQSQMGEQVIKMLSKKLEEVQFFKDSNMVHHTLLRPKLIYRESF